MMPATSNLVLSRGLPRPIIKSHQKNSGCGHGLEVLPKIWGFPFNISAMAGASNFKFCMPLGSFKAHHKITPVGKIRCGIGLGSSPKFWGFPIIFLQRLKLATSKMACGWDLPRHHHKNPHRRKSGRALG